MIAGEHVVKVGEIECFTVCDGSLPYPTAWFFSNAPREELETELRARQLPADHVVSPYICLLIRSGKETLLLDTGAGAMAPSTGELPVRLKELGVSPQQVTTVFLTHAHSDHVGGVLDATGKPAFPNARYVMAKAEWDFWTGSPSLERLQLEPQIREVMLDCARRNLPPLKPQLELVEREAEIVPGVRAIPAPGHTPGHTAVLISSGTEQLLHVSDVVLHPIHLARPEWRAVFDLDPDMASNTRRHLLDRAASDDVPVHAYHFQFPGLGRVTKRGHAWTWEADAGLAAQIAS